jgi:hypothetical protein
MSYHVMQSDRSQAAGFRHLGEYDTKSQAERVAKGLDPKLNGKPMGRVGVWNQKAYDDWHENDVMPYYR